jgi:hypothetical protein
MPTLTNGLVVMTPTSVAKTGTGSTATINSDGSVTFSACETLSLNGVFTSSYDNYMIAIRHTCNQSSAALSGRLRVSGSDATGTNYTRQYILALDTSVTAARESTQSSARIAAMTNSQRGGDTCFVFGPFLAQPTAFRYAGIYPDLNAGIADAVSTHSLSTSYDGLTLFMASGNFTGLLTVFGFNQ